MNGVECKSHLSAKSGWSTESAKCVKTQQNIHCMTKFLFTALMLLSAAAQASAVQLSLVDKATSERSNYSFDISERNFHGIASIQGTLLPQLEKYTSQNRKLIGNGIVLANTDEILFQCEIDGVDLVVVRIEYNSLLGPLKLLGALSGHPVQISKIILLTIANNAVASEKEITRKESAYRWLVGIYN